MPAEEKMIEEFVSLINQYFVMDIIQDQENAPYIQAATVKSGHSLEDFLNDFVNVVESTDTKGKLMYYFDNRLDFDTPEEYHRH